MFEIDADQFSWICGPEDDSEDLCLHGHVTVQIGKTVMEYDGTVSATALYLLKTLTEDKVMSEYDIHRICPKSQSQAAIMAWTGLLFMRTEV